MEKLDSCLILLMSSQYCVSIVLEMGREPEANDSEPNALVITLAGVILSATRDSTHIRAWILKTTDH